MELASLLTTEDYPAALALIRKELRRGLREPQIADEYLQAINGTLALASDAFTSGGYARAGALLQQARLGYPHEATLVARVELPPRDLDARIDSCAEELMEHGLAAYRSGELGSAIQIWEQILTFDPEHKAARKAIQTTRLQLDNLETLDNRP